MQVLWALIEEDKIRCQTRESARLSLNFAVLRERAAIYVLKADRLPL